MMARPFALQSATGVNRLQSTERMMPAVDSGCCSRDTKTSGASRLQSTERMMPAVDSGRCSRETKPLGASRLQSAERMMPAVDSGCCSCDTKTLGASRLQSAERVMSAVDSDTHRSAEESPLAPGMDDSDGLNCPTPNAWVPADLSLLTLERFAASRGAAAAASVQGSGGSPVVPPLPSAPRSS